MATTTNPVSTPTQPRQTAELTPIKIWALNNSGAVVCATEFESLDAAELAARIWNRSETRPGMRVDILMNAATAREATRVRAVY